jgi:putative glutamine amidotransferase
MPRPIIGITTDIETRLNSRGVDEERYFLKTALTNAVEKAGGMPIIIPFLKSLAEVSSIIKNLNGLIISGGDFDIDPKFYGESRMKKCGPAKPDRTKSEILLLKEALKADLPVLGICGGEQLINVYFGGTLYQDIPSQVAGALRHSQQEPHHTPTHDVKIAQNSFLHSITSVKTMKVNSTHHQSIKNAGKGLKVSATAPDGGIEAVEMNGKFLLGVQWHPEFLTKNKAHLSIFKAFIKAAKNRSQARKA